MPAITVFEAGRDREEPDAIAAFERGARRLLAGLGVLDASDTSDVSDASDHGTPAPAIHPRRLVLLADTAATWSPARAPGTRVRAGELLGTLAGSSRVPRPVRATAGGVILHIRRTGPAAAGTPLAILAAEP